MIKTKTDNVNFDILDYSNTVYEFKQKYFPRRKIIKPIQMIVSKIELEKLSKIKEERKNILKKLVDKEEKDSKTSSSLDKMKNKIKNKIFYNKSNKVSKFDTISDGYKHVMLDIDFTDVKPANTFGSNFILHSGPKDHKPNFINDNSQNDDWMSLFDLNAKENIVNAYEPSNVSSAPFPAIFDNNNFNEKNKTINANTSGYYPSFLENLFNDLNKKS